MSQREPVTPPGSVTPPDEGRTASQAFRVRFDEATPTGRVRTSALLRYAADLAWVHSEQRGFGRSWYTERGLAWVVRGVDLELLAPIDHGAVLVGTTEAVAARKVIARRRSDFVGPDGRTAARLIVDWALTTTDGTPTRIPALFGTVFTMPNLAFAPIRVRPSPTADDTRPAPRVLDLVVRPQELDPMGHVNNAVYLDWAEEAIRDSGLEGVASLDAIPRRWRLEYLGAAAVRRTVRALAWPEAGDWSCRMEDAATGTLLVGARLET